MVAKVIDRNPLYYMKNFRYSAEITMKIQTIMQVKEILSSFPPNIKLHLINYLSDNLSDNIDLYIESTYFIL